jgi:RNA polymerase sigma-70 factor (ECF subfamily)
LLFRRHSRVLFSYFYRRTGCAETAGDLTAETFAEAFVSRHRYKDTGAPFRAWLFSIARRKVSRMIRKGRVEAKARQRLGMERIAMDDASYERIEALDESRLLREELKNALALLSPKLQDAVRLRFYEELPYAEVATRLGCSEGTVRTRVARALTQLSQSVEV